MALEPGSKAGPYIIKGQLGRGGMASVYLAHDPALERNVALKVLPREFLHDPDFIGRFKIEARAVASLEHPNIIPIYAYDVDQEEGIPWMAMRYVQGGALSDLLKKQRPPRSRSIEILRGVADALDYAHAKKVVHRDIKPQNVLLDEAGRVYLADFGVVKMLESPSGLTATGMITGTPQYMAPEQATAKAVDNRADIYSLGIVAYQMFTGRVPFTADTPVAILMMHVQEPVPPPSPELVPDPLASALLKALAKQPEDRWYTAGAFVAALEAGLRSPSSSPSRTFVNPPTVELPSGDQKALTDPTRIVPAPVRSSWIRGCAVLLFRFGLAVVLGVVAAVAGLVWLGREEAPVPVAVDQPSPAPTPLGTPSEAPLSTPSEPAPSPTAVAASPSAAVPVHSPETQPLATPPASLRPAPTSEPVTSSKATPLPTPEPPHVTAPAVSPVVQGLLQSLSAPDVATRWRSAEALGNLGQEAEPAVAPLTAALRDRSADVRWRSAEALGKIGLPAAAAVPAVAALLRDSDDLVRGEAAKALGRFGPAAEPAVQALAEGLRHPEVAFRREVAKALARVGPGARDAVTALAAALADKDKFVRMESARALGNIGPPARSAVTALTAAARDSEILVARQAQDALKKVVPD
jgi:serine/threonine-protein kinase